MCAAAGLVPCDSDIHGIEPIFEITRTYVVEMKRDPNYHFMYAVMSAINDADSEGVVETFA